MILNISGCLVASVPGFLVFDHLQRFDVFTFQSRPSAEFNNPSRINHQHSIQLPYDGKYKHKLTCLSFYL